jgi:DNA-binding CsgD family transcriptional regulator
MEIPAAPALETFAVETATVSPLDLLSSRERDVVSLALEGATNAEIANRLGISLRTVEDRLRRAFHQLGVRNRKHLIVVLMFAERPRAAAAEPPNLEKIQ